MTKDKDKVKMLDVQAGYETPASTFDRNSIGYTDRPINARTQTYNRYLDSCTINDSWQSTGVVDFRTSTKRVVGSLQWNIWYFNNWLLWSWYWVIIPNDWTYIITTSFTIDAATQWLINAYYFRWTNWTYITGSVWVAVYWSWDQFSWVATLNLNKWDIIYNEIDSDWQVNMELSITKLS